MSQFTFKVMYMPQLNPKLIDWIKDNITPSMVSETNGETAQYQVDAILDLARMDLVETEATDEDKQLCEEVLSFNFEDCDYVEL